MSSAPSASSRPASESLISALPPLPSEPADDAVESRFAAYWSATQAGSSFVASLRARPAFANPYLLEETIATFGIDESATGLPRSAFDPKSIPDCDYYEALAVRQAAEDSARANARANAPPRTTIPFVPPREVSAKVVIGGVGGGGAGGDVSVDAAGPTKRSRWG